MKVNVFIVMFITLLSVSCTTKPFDRIYPTEVEQYSIVYDDDKCALYDNVADTLITALKYDALHYNRTTMEDGLEISIWGCQLDSCIGMLAIEHSTNETLEFIFPKTE